MLKNVCVLLSRNKEDYAAIIISQNLEGKRLSASL